MTAMKPKRALARKLRRSPSSGEWLLWQRLRRSQLEGCKFRLQAPLGPFIVDFVCLGRRLVVEVDGPFHETERDERRDGWLGSQGFRVLRFPYLQVVNTPTEVVDVIREALQRGPLGARPLTGEEMAERLGYDDF